MGSSKGSEKSEFPDTDSIQCSSQFFLFKPGFHMSGKSQTIRDFTFCRLSQILLIYRIIVRSLSQILPILNLAGIGKCAKKTNGGRLEPNNIEDW